MPRETQYCTFHVGPLYLGVDVHEVQEVIRTLDVTFVPLAPQAVRGLINLRGQIITAIDLRERLGLPPRQDEVEPMHIVVRTDEAPVSFMVDGIDDVTETLPLTFEPAPSTLDARARALIGGVHKLDGRLLHVLETARVANVDDPE